ncbi:glycosyltransferase family 4 protein [Acidobacteria bacterium AH-259-L09]|nr:glycosyltransferase family 4 protein [Acidobacteria bacterium AH-259-L09]
MKNIGFISTRIAGTDGVSLEIGKWSAVLERNHYHCFYFAGLCDRPAEKCFLVDEAHFEHPEVKKITDASFGKRRRDKEISELSQRIKDYLKEKIYQFTEHFEIQLLIAENALAIPMNIPLGLAITEFVGETGFPTIAHHHDFFWERDRFLVNCVSNYLTAAFPPDLPTLRHVVINSLAGRQLSYRKGVPNILIPNVYDYTSPPFPADDYCRDLRKEIGLSEDDLFILQPTRVVPRKGIELAIYTVYSLRLKNPVLVISHASGDEGDIYYRHIKEYANQFGVKLVSIDHLVGSQRRVKKDGQKIYTIGDVYQSADLVTYPSSYEGFGNAFLEAIYYRKPIVVNRYSIYVVDIEPKGFDVIAFDGLVSRDTIEQIRMVLNDASRAGKMVEKNYQLALRYYSYEVLEEDLRHLIRQFNRHGH